MTEQEQVDLEVLLSTVLVRLRESSLTVIRVEVNLDQQYGDEPPYDVLTVEFRRKEQK